MSAIAAGCLHSLAVTADGTVWAWGHNANGQLGNGTTHDSRAPIQVPGLKNIIAVSAGRGHSLALSSNGTVWAWGDNYDGELGIGHACDPVTLNYCASSIPMAVPGLSGVVAIAAGGQHSLALTANGTVYSWGANDYGQLGNGTTTASDAPVAVGGLNGVTAIAAGGYHSLALTANGVVWAWGLNSSGQLGTPGPLSLVPAPIQGINGVIAVAAGERHSLALTADGTVWAWGANDHGQLGTGTVCADCGSVKPVPVAGLSGAIAVAAGASHSLAVIGPMSSIAPTGLSFPAQLIGTSGATQTVTISNTGGVPLVISSAAVTGTNAADFPLTASSCAILPPSGTCAITVGFTPSGPGPRSAQLVVLDNSIVSTHTITLRGAGTAPPTATPSPTMTPLPPTRTPTPPAAGIGLPLAVAVAPHTVLRNQVVEVLVQTQRGLRVGIDLRVTASRAVLRGQGRHRHRVIQTTVLYDVRAHGIADAQGLFTGYLRVHYAPRRPVVAVITVSAYTSGRPVTLSTRVTIRP